MIVASLLTSVAAGVIARGDGDSGRDMFAVKRGGTSDFGRCKPRTGE